VHKMPDHSTSALQFWLNSPAIKSADFPENPATDPNFIHS